MTEIEEDDGSQTYVYATGRLKHVGNEPPARNRVFRCPDPLYFAAQARAKERGENLSTVIRRALERYAKQRPSDVARDEGEMPGPEQ